MSNWLIVRARELSEAGVAPRHGDADSTLNGPSGRPRPRSPTGHPGLPCDWLFSVAVEAVIIVETTTHRIVQANPAAANLLGSSQADLIGSRFLDTFDAASCPVILQSMVAAHAPAVAEEVNSRSAGNGAELRAKVSMFRAGTESYLLVRLTSIADDDRQIDAQSTVFDAIEGAAVGFLLTDSGLRVEYANQALIDMVELATPAEIRGRSLARWLEFSAADLVTLRDQMLQRQASSVMTGRLRTERGSFVEVEVCAVAVPDGAQTCWGFTLRELHRLN